MSENEVLALLEYNMRWIGGEGVSFPTIVAIGPNSSLPHHHPGRKRVKASTPILIDFGAVAEGYCGSWDLSERAAEEIGVRDWPDSWDEEKIWGDISPEKRRSLQRLLGSRAPKWMDT
jgi:hypothetical protein